MIDPSWKKPVRVVIREEIESVYEFDAIDCETEEDILNMAHWLHTDLHLERHEPDKRNLLSETIAYLKGG